MTTTGHERDIVATFPPTADEPPDTRDRLDARRERRPGAVVLSPRGEVDAYTQNRWCRLLDDAASRLGPGDQLVVDLRELTFLSCRALEDLAVRAQRCHAAGGRLLVVADQPWLVRVSRAIGLDEWLPVATRVPAGPADVVPPASPGRACVPRRPPRADSRR
ncbi:anti-sigma factor antagonist [Nocardia thailandica]